MRVCAIRKCHILGISARCSFDFFHGFVYGRYQFVNVNVFPGFDGFAIGVDEVEEERIGALVVKDLNFPLVLEALHGEFQSRAVFSVLGNAVAFVVHAPTHHNDGVIPKDLQDVGCHPALLF